MPSTNPERDETRFVIMAKKIETTDYSMEEKIKALYALQMVDSKIDEINKIKGELPLEVQDLEDDVAGLGTRIENFNSEIEELNDMTRQRKRDLDEASLLITKYEEQQNNVRNNREFDALAKEIEYQKLEIELANKHLKEYSAAIKAKKQQVEEAEAVLGDRKLDLEQKQTELAGIEKETEKEIAVLEKEQSAAAEKIDERMLNAYRRIRANMHNGLAVVTVKRDACGGCYNRIPPQRQVDIRQNKKIIVCEYCGRILVAE